MYVESIFREHLNGDEYLYIGTLFKVKWTTDRTTLPLDRQKASRILT